MRAPSIKTKIKPGCVICKHQNCINDRLSTRITRSFSKVLHTLKDFIILEIYRCMPLLGDEQDKVPDWDVHIVRYAIVFLNSTPN